ncbi:B-cell receptor CD22 isoform X2 [Salmo salar]|uniref:B-cell receptor CD22 isoform X2 n=1 Tax=Salmo salar TaxID=8030 RepID=A0ABM3EBZ9_SALSA|nr:B-cell receptor CD22-like isoform X2 [Salmo salar]
MSKTLTCITTCTLTGNPTYIWYKNGQHLDESTSPQYKYSVYSNYVDSYSCAVKGHEDLHSPAVCVQGQDCSRVTYTKRRICVLKGSTVDISCTYVGYYSTTSTFWFRSDKSTPEDLTSDPGYTGRVKYTGPYRGPFILRITDLREEDSAEYRFTFKTDNFEWGHSFPGTTLSVTGLQVKVTPAAEGQKTLTCITTCTLTDNPTYIWYKNGQRLDEPTSQQYSVNSYYSDSYSCTVKGHEDHHSPAVCVLGESCMNVTYTHHSICALKGSTVDISCFYTHPSWHKVTEVSWFNKWESGVTKDLRQDSEYADRVEYHRQTEKDSTLRITDLRESDSTEYKFRFTTDKARWGYSFHGTTLTVTGTQVEVTPEWRSESKTLSCSTTCPLSNHNPTYIWYKNGQHLDESTSPQYKDPVSSNYEDSYSCAVKGHEDLHSPAVCVQGQICSRVTYTKRRICVLKGSTVDISCTYVGYYSTTSTFWFRSDKSTPEDLTSDPGYTGRVKYTGPYRGPFILRITDLREEDSAEYRFTFKTDYVEWGHSFPGTTLSVTGLQVKVTPAAEGQKTLTCITTCTLTDNPTYIWYKNGQNVQDNSSPMYSISSEDADSYYCAVKGQEDLSSPAVYKPKKTSVSVSPSGEIVEGSSVTLTCSSDANPPVDKYTWYFQNKTFLNGFGQMYNISKFKSKDNGHYHCEAWNGRGSRNSTALMIILPVKQTSVLTAAVGIIVVVLVLILCLSGLMWFRKKASISTSDTRDTSENVQGDSSPVYENVSSMAMTPTAAKTATTVIQDDVHYASVHFSRFKNQEVPLYSTVQLPQPQQQDEDVQYDAVKFNLSSAANRPTAAQAAEEDSSEIYSRVNKPRGPEHNKPRTKKT